MKTPDVTTAQILTLVAAVLSLGAAFGLDLSKDKQDAIVQLVTVLGPFLLIADSVIRHGRATGGVKKAVKKAPAKAPAK